MNLRLLKNFAVTLRTFQLAKMQLRKMLALLLLLSAFALSSCASYFVRQECKKIDWYDFGYKTAMSGNRLSNNATINKCEKAEAEIDHTALDQGFKKGMRNYCEPETTYITGKSGEFFQEAMCDGSNLKLLKAKHAEGVREYCKKNNGYLAGAKGSPYNQICPKDQEADFIPEFNRGRKKYLSESIRNKEQELNGLNQQMWSLESRRNSLTLQLASLSSRQTITKNRVWTGSGYREETQVTEDPAVVSQRNSLQNQIHGVDSEVNSIRSKQAQLRNEISELNNELAKL